MECGEPLKRTLQGRRSGPAPGNSGRKSPRYKPPCAGHLEVLWACFLLGFAPLGDEVDEDSHQDTGRTEQ